MYMSQHIFIMTSGKTHQNRCLPEDGSEESISFLIKLRITQIITDILSPGLRQLSGSCSKYLGWFLTLTSATVVLPGSLSPPPLSVPPLVPLSLYVLSLPSPSSPLIMFYSLFFSMQQSFHFRILYIYLLLQNSLCLRPLGIIVQFELFKYIVLEVILWPSAL